MQMSQGASTRSRWGWFLENANRDPYHVKIASNLQQTKTNKIYHRAYLRSYKPAGSDDYVTGSITNNPLVTAESAADWDTATYGEAPKRFSGGSHDNLPTEYMLLGESADECKLVTTYRIDGGEEDYDISSRYTVHSFEQFWKNSPTVFNLLCEYHQYTSKEDQDALKTRLDASGLNKAIRN